MIPTLSLRACVATIAGLVVAVLSVAAALHAGGVG